MRRGRRGFERFRPGRIDHVDLAVKGVAEGVVLLGRGDIQQQVAVLADRAGRVGNAYAVLSADVAAVGRVSTAAKSFQPHLAGSVARFGCGIESRPGAVGGVELVDLRPARAGVPRIRVDLLDLDGLAQVDRQPAAVFSLGEEEVPVGLVLFGGHLAIVQDLQIAARRRRGGHRRS